MVNRHIVYVYTHIIQEEKEEDLCRIMKDRDGCADRQGRMNIIRTHTTFSEQIVQNGHLLIPVYALLTIGINVMSFWYLPQLEL